MPQPRPEMTGEQTRLAYRPQTTVDTMARIEAGVDPWIAVRDFLEDWTYLPESRESSSSRTVRRSPPRMSAGGLPSWPPRSRPCAFARGSPFPAWTREPVFRLEEAWYLYEGTGRIRDWLRETTPPAFSSRNIWSGDRLLRRT